MLAMRGLATGLCAGCVVGLLRLSHDRAAARVALWLEEWREVWWTVPIWFGVLVALAVILRRIVREEPLISGSGIPQTELALAGRLSFTWWRVLLAKFLGSWLALFGGLALGREGPSIQMGGAVGAGFHALWRPAAPHALTGSPYVVAGAVAGLAANGYLLLCERLLGGRGAFRVHGGGFAGTVQAFVPEDMLAGFRAGIDSVLGAGSCHVLSIRREGGCMMEKM